MNQEYKLSGKPGNIWLIGIIVGPILAVLLSIIYAYIDVYNPFVYLTFLVYLGYLFGIVLVQKLVVKIAKCRSTTSSYIYGTLVSLFAIYANWCTFLFVLIQRYDDAIPLSDLLTSPSVVFDMASTLSETGWYELFGFQISGVALWIIWIIEIIGILAAGIIGGSTVMHEEVFCENCKRWAEDVDFNLRLSMKDEAKVNDAIKNNIAALTEVPIAHNDENPHVRLNMNHCSQCNNLSTIDVDLIRYETNDKGEVEEKDEDYSPVILITKELYDKFILKKANAAEKNTESQAKG